jgi:hypothetical protein
MGTYIYNTRKSLILLSGLLAGGIIVLSFGHGMEVNYLLQTGHGMIMTALLWGGCMMIVQLLWKKYPWEKRPAHHLVLEIVMILPYTMLVSVGLYLVEIKLDIFEARGGLLQEEIITILITFLVTAIHESVYFYKQWKYNFSRSVRLEKDSIQAKYESLKTQINPHFLFNSLNSLTTLVDDNEAAVSYISNLSDFFRYMLASREKELVLVREEVNLLKKYISLQQSRFKQNLVVEIDVPERYYHYAIPPLVLQMLVENSIKHNIISRDKPLKITIYSGNGSITVENNLQRKSGVRSTGQGLRNIRERYAFFTTENIKITENSSSYKVSVPLLKAEL